jgi:predicted PhzF superfamily epimerase YddE/YHI9
MIELTVLRVFVGPDGRGGNPLGVIVDGWAVDEARRQAVAAKLGFSETVFVDNATTGAIRIFTPASELGFAGHPTVGTSWLLRRLGVGGSTLRLSVGEVAAWEADGIAWVRANPAWIHEIDVVQHADAAEVEALPVDGGPSGSTYHWAWVDEPAGVLRSRYFVPALGIGEDEATGAAAVMMGGRLGRPLDIRQGVGSQLLVRPGEGGWVEIGGRVEPVETRELDG